MVVIPVTLANTSWLHTALGIKCNPLADTGFPTQNLQLSFQTHPPPFPFLLLPMITCLFTAPTKPTFLREGSVSWTSNTTAFPVFSYRVFCMCFSLYAECSASSSMTHAIHLPGPPGWDSVCAATQHPPNRGNSSGSPGQRKPSRL